MMSFKDSNFILASRTTPRLTSLVFTSPPPLFLPYLVKPSPNSCWCSSYLLIPSWGPLSSATSVSLFFLDVAHLTALGSRLDLGEIIFKGIYLPWLGKLGPCVKVLATVRTLVRSHALKEKKLAWCYVFIISKHGG